MQQFKIRCSAIGQIMTNDRSGKGMGKTVHTYLETWVKEQLYKRRKEFSNKYTQKGLIVEDNSIDFIAEQLDYGFLIKNEENFSNEFLTGTPDVILSDHVIDVKNSWDCFTFPLFDTEVENKDYYWQAQGYMELCNKDSYKLIYTLTNTPEHLIEREAKNFCYKNGFEELDADVYLDFYKKMTFDDVPNDLKIKVFEIKRDKDAYNSIVERVKLCRTEIEKICKTQVVVTVK